MTFPDDLAEAVENYQQAQEAPPSLTAVVQAALRQYLTERGFLRARRALHIARARRGSGHRDISLQHDRYLAEGRGRSRIAEMKHSVARTTGIGPTRQSKEEPF